MSKIMVVAPHPDDEVYGCGGSIVRHSRAGDEVHVLIVTRGDDLFDQDLIEQGRREALEAHKLLGVHKTHFADLPAIKLDTLPGYQINEVLQKHFVEVEPDVLFIPFPGDVNIDHRIVHSCSMVAARPITLKVSRILCYEALSATNWNSAGIHPVFAPNVFVDISETIELKLEAVRTYTSQLREHPHERSVESVKALACYRGGFANLSHAEAFMCVREIIR